MIERGEQEKAAAEFERYGEAIAGHILDARLIDTNFEHATSTTKKGSVCHEYTIKMWIDPDADIDPDGSITDGV